MAESALPVAVIGGGVAGLAMAYQLRGLAAERGLTLALVVFEKRDEPGGHLRTRCQDGFQVEEGPNGWLDSEPATGRLIARLGLTDALQRSEDASRRRFIRKQGRQRELPLTPPAFLRSDIVSVRAKLRMAAEILVPPRENLDRAAIDPSADESVYEFGCRRLGREFAETLLDPMVKGVYGGDARRLSLAAAFPRMVELERDHGGLLRAMLALSRRRRGRGHRKQEALTRQEHPDDGNSRQDHDRLRRREPSPAAGPRGTLHSFRRGMAVLPHVLATRLRAAGVEIQTGAAVQAVRRRGEDWWLEAAGRQRGPFAAVVDASPAHAAARHLEDARLRDLLAGIPYAPIAVVALGFDRDQVTHPLDGFGVLNPTSEGRRLLGVLWTSSIFRDRAPAGSVLLRCMAGGARDPGFLAMADDELVALCLAEAAADLRIRGRPQHHWIFRHRQAIAQYEVGHLARLAAISAVLAAQPGLFLTGSSYRGISVNHCLAEAERSAVQILAWLARRAGLQQIAPDGTAALPAPGSIGSLAARNGG